MTSTTVTKGAIDGHRLTEFIYGTVTSLVAVAGLSAAHGSENWWQSALAVIAGAIAIWAAHAYSGLMSKRVTTGRQLAASEVGEQLSSTWPIVVAGVIVASPFALNALGLVGYATSVWIANIVGVLVLALVGVLAGYVTRSGWLRTIGIAVLSAGLGLFVVVVELALAH